MSTIYWPFDPSLISYGFGNAPGYGGWHNGIDFGVKQGTELRATAAGRVSNVDAGQIDGAGVDIQTPDGWKVRMWHVSAFLVPHGSYVELGQVIALSGGARGTWGAGNSTGAHLHWGVALDGRNNWVDPATLSPKTFGSSPITKNENKMLMIHKPNGDGQFIYAIFQGTFWLEFTGQDTANGFASQIGAPSVLVSNDFWNYCKKAANV